MPHDRVEQLCYLGECAHPLAPTRHNADLGVGIRLTDLCAEWSDLGSITHAVVWELSQVDAAVAELIADFNHPDWCTACLQSIYLSEHLVALHCQNIEHPDWASRRRTCRC